MCCSFQTCAQYVSAILLALAIVFNIIIPRQAPPGLTCEASKVSSECKEETGAVPLACSSSVFIGLTKQPDLGLWHYEEQDQLKFARWKHAGCDVEYSIVCVGKKWEVLQTGTCANGNSNIKRSTDLKLTWEACAKKGNLTLEVPVADLTFDVPIAAGTLVQGCVRVSAASTTPGLEMVKGPLKQQIEALREKKKEVGGCPTWNSTEAMIQRAQDFAAVYGKWLGLAVKFHLHIIADYVQMYKASNFPLPKPVKYFMLMPLMQFGGGIHAYGGLVTTRITCGMPVPSYLPMSLPVVTRHAETARLIGDPQQKRAHIIGMGNSSVCFDATLPVFMSTGELPHTQVRKLWDAVGIASMHQVDLPDIPPIQNTFIDMRRPLMKAIGMGVPQLDEVAMAVTPLFLEVLWGKKPAQDEADVISAYPTSGALCIFSSVLEQLPVLPGKVMAIREAAFKFARESPLGKRLAEEIQKPDYAELRATYAERPKGIVGTATQNLVDASLFAGLVGTSTMTVNCLERLSQGGEFVKMFNENSTAFLLEVMRTKSAVLGSQTKLQEPWKLTVAGEQIVVPAGSTVFQATGLTAGYDRSVFPDPYTFDSRRMNLGETQNFNGLTKYVLTRNYTGAPRFCPGAATALRIAAKVCSHFAAQVISPDEQVCTVGKDGQQRCDL